MDEQESFASADAPLADEESIPTMQDDAPFTGAERVDFVSDEVEQASYEEPLEEDFAPYELPGEEPEDLDGQGGEALAKPGDNPSALANSASQQLMEGLEAVRNVHALARQHADAREKLETLRRELDDAMDILDHRVEIERNYQQIVADQTAQIQAAQGSIEAARERSEALASERQQLSARLTALKAENEEALRPYKNLMDTTKGRADDAALALADARRAVKAGESAANDATRKRDSRVSAANRAVDNAQERLRKVQTELDKLQGDPDAPITALPKMRDELVAERAHLDDAREEVEKVTAETQRAVEEAQSQLFSLRQTLEAAERVAEDAKREAAERREEYDRLYKEARAAEGEVSESIRTCTAAIDELENTIDEIDEQIDGLQIVLDEANDIHETPEVTTQLRDRITAGQAELERQDREVKDLAQSERHLRESTRGKRIAFFAVVAAIVLVAILLIWFFATRR